MAELRLIKNVIDTENPRNDNSDKAELLPEGKHPRIANEYKEEWDFIAFESARDNIAYLMQYVEFNVLLYNEFKLYLTLESQLCKTLLITISGIVESALFESLHQQDAGIDERTSFSELIALAFKRGLIGGGQKLTFDELRITRNNIHLAAADKREYEAYTIEQVNHALEDLEMLRSRLFHIFTQ